MGDSHKAYRQGGNHNTAEHETLRKIQHEPDSAPERLSFILRYQAPTRKTAA